jgi:hypothetical protein
MREAFEEIERWGRKIGANIARLRLIGARETAQRCVDLRSAINNRELVGTVMGLQAQHQRLISAQLHGQRE